MEIFDAYLNFYVPVRGTRNRPSCINIHNLFRSSNRDLIDHVSDIVKCK